MPRPLTYTSTLAVPRSMPMYLENTPKSAEVYRTALRSVILRRRRVAARAVPAASEMNPGFGALDGEPRGLGLQSLTADDGFLERLARPTPRRLRPRLVDLVLAFGRVGQDQHPVARHLQEPAAHCHRLLV